MKRIVLNRKNSYVWQLIYFGPLAAVNFGPPVAAFWSRRCGMPAPVPAVCEDGLAFSPERLSGSCSTNRPRTASLGRFPLYDAEKYKWRHLIEDSFKNSKSSTASP
jgi:hypothetical protein